MPYPAKLRSKKQHFANFLVNTAPKQAVALRPPPSQALKKEILSVFYKKLEPIIKKLRQVLLA